MLVYLAGAIDAVSPSDAKDWRTVATEGLTKRGHSTFDPAHAFGGSPRITHQDASRVLEINQCALDRCNAVLANLAGDSWGTPVEIEQAWSQDTPVYGFGAKWEGLYAKTRLSEWCPTLEEALKLFAT